VLILFAQFWELYVMVAPAIGHGHEAAHAHLPVVEFAATLGFLGLFTLVFGWSLARHDAVPLKDPAIAACSTTTRETACGSGRPCSGWSSSASSWVGSSGRAGGGTRPCCPIRRDEGR